MPVLTIPSSKGGPGKSTVTMLLAAILAVEGRRVVVLDADPTQALSRWAANTYEGTAIDTAAEADETRLAHLINEKVDAADLVLVDTAGFGNRAATVAMTSADAILVPALAGEADLTEAENTVRLAEASREQPGARSQSGCCSIGSGARTSPATPPRSWPRLGCFGSRRR